MGLQQWNMFGKWNQPYHGGLPEITFGGGGIGGSVLNGCFNYFWYFFDRFSISFGVFPGAVCLVFATVWS